MPSLTLAGEDGSPLFQRVARRMEGLIAAGALRPGDRLPSVRRLSRQLAVSVSTVIEAYRLLEDQRLVEARPQSGFYVRPSPGTLPEPGKSAGRQVAVEPEVSELVLRILREASDPELVPLGAAVPSPEFFPTGRLSRLLARVARSAPQSSHAYEQLQGHLGLREQVARRAVDAGCTLAAEEIVITAGAQEAVHLCLRAVTRPGDTVVVESPTYYGLLEALESLHLKVLEVATDPRLGLCLEDLEEALGRHRVAACVLVPTFGNPLGHCMPEARKQRLVEMLAEREVPLIEDDVYGDLSFASPRPPAVRAFDSSGNVLLCSSFSKTLAPGYRIGWAAPGRFQQTVERLKFSTSVATASPTQLAVAAFLAGGGFDHYLRKLRRTYKDLCRRMTCAVSEFFPPETRVTRPEGGHLLWVELPAGTHSLHLHEEALAAGMSIAPGPLFSTTSRYDHFIRLNCAVPWSSRVEDAMQRLGKLVAAG